MHFQEKLRTLMTIFSRMRIRITDIPPSGLKVNDHLPLEALNARVHSDMSFTVTPKVDLMVHKTIGGAEVKGSIETSLRQACGRCADPRELPMKLPVFFTLIHKERKEGEGPVEENDDIGVFFFEGEHFELEPPLQELLILQINPFWSPPLDTGGRCTLCREQCHHIDQPAKGGGGTSLGELLARATRSGTQSK